MGRLLPEESVTHHHLMASTAQHAYWLEEPEVKDMFLDLLDFLCRIFYVETLGFVVMGTHYHLCVKVSRPKFDLEDIRRRFELAQSRMAYPRKFQEAAAEGLYKRYTDLSKFMWYLNRIFAGKYNKLKGTKGRFWSSPYKNIVVEDGKALLAVLSYIELNPVRAGMVEDPASFEHSSVGRIAKAIQKGETPEAPGIESLKQLPEKIRALTYLDWISYVALTVKDQSLQRETLPKQFTDKGWMIDMGAIYEALATKAPENWSTLVYGSGKYKKEILEAAGWLIPIGGLREAPPSGDSKAAA